jgi:hypothetical protein
VVDPPAADWLATRFVLRHRWHIRVHDGSGTPVLTTDGSGTLGGVTTVGAVNDTKPGAGNDDAAAVRVILGDEVENLFSTNGRETLHASTRLARVKL